MFIGEVSDDFGEIGRFESGEDGVLFVGSLGEVAGCGEGYRVSVFMD